MPKLESPFKREIVNGIYVCVPQIAEGYEWVFEEGVVAVEKLDGTNVSIEVKDGKIIKVRNRKNVVDIWKKGNKKFADSLFYGHLVLEKILKAVYIQKNQSSPPFVHDLLLLARKSQLKIDGGVAKKLEIITGFNINGRYDDYKSSFYNVA